MNTKQLIVWLCGLVMLASCGGGHSHEHEAESEHHAESEHESEHHHDDGMIELSAENAKASGVETAVVKRGDFNDVIAVSGRITTSLTDETVVAATVSGIVKVLKPLTEGLQVGRGVTLFSVSSKGLQEGDAVQKARIEYEAARRQYERDAQLLKDHIVSEKHFESTKAAYENARLAYEALGAGRSEGTGVATRQAGFVKELLVKDGDFVEIGQPMLILTRNQMLTLRAELPERYLEKAPLVQSAKFRLASSERVYDTRQMGGKRLPSATMLSEGSHYLPIAFEMPRTEGLVAGTYAEVWLVCGGRKDVLAVDNSALTEEQGVFYVYVKMPGKCHNRYRKTEVTLSATDGERTEVVEGLKDGDEVVVKGAPQVRLAGASGEIPAHNHEH